MSRVVLPTLEKRSKNTNKLPYYTATQVAEHSTKNDCWVIVHDNVVDVTRFLSQHPGGVGALSKQGRGGCDVTPHFERIGHSTQACSRMEAMRIGLLHPTPLGGGEEDDATTVDPSQTKTTAGGVNVHVVVGAEPNTAAYELDGKDMPSKPDEDEESYALEWHAERRTCILAAHPEIRKLMRPNYFTPLLGLFICTLHVVMCWWCCRLAWPWVLLATYTVGAFCKMYQFGVGHEICHGNCGGYLTGPKAKLAAMHFFTLPSFGGEVHQYFAYQHIGHHSSLGSMELNNVSSLSDIDGDLPAASSLLLLINDASAEELGEKTKRIYNSKLATVVAKFLLTPFYQAAHFISVLMIEILPSLFISPPIQIIFAFVLLCWPGGIERWFNKVGDVKPGSGIVVSDELLWFVLDFAFHTWLSYLVLVAVLVYSDPASGYLAGVDEWLLQAGLRTSNDDGAGWPKGLIYLLLSDMFLHGFAFHPYFGYFLGVHRSRGKPGQFTSGKGTSRDSDTCQPTMSTYSFITSCISMNLNYHVEHHDFPNIPWSRLPAVKSAASEFYDTLDYSPGYSATIYRWFKGGGWQYACMDGTKTPFV